MAAHERELMHWLSENWATLRAIVEERTEKPKKKPTKHKEAEGGQTD